MSYYRDYFDIYRQEFVDHFLKALLIFEESTSSPESASDDGQIWPFQPQQVRPRLVNILSQKTHVEAESILPETIGPFLVNQLSRPWRNYVFHHQHCRSQTHSNSEYFTVHGMQMLCLVLEDVGEEICRSYEHQILSLATAAEVRKLASYTVLRIFRYAVQHKQATQLHRNDLLVAVASRHATVSSDRTVQHLKSALGVYDSMLYTRHGDSWLLKKIFSCPGVRVHKGAGNYDFYADMHTDPASLAKYGFRHPIYLWQDHDLPIIHSHSHSNMTDTDMESSNSISIGSSSNLSSGGVHFYTSYIPHPTLDHEKSTFQKVDLSSLLSARSHLMYYYHVTREEWERLLSRGRDTKDAQDNVGLQDVVAMDGGSWGADVGRIVVRGFVGDGGMQTHVSARLYLRKVTFRNVDLNGLNLQDADVSGSTFQACSLRNLQLAHATLRKVTISECDTRGGHWGVGVAMGLTGWGGVGRVGSLLVDVRNAEVQEPSELTWLEGLVREGGLVLDAVEKDKEEGVSGEGMRDANPPSFPMRSLSSLRSLSSAFFPPYFFSASLDDDSPPPIDTDRAGVDEEEKLSFVGRTEVLEELREFFFPPAIPTVAVSATLVKVLRGAGGMGRTSLIKRFVELYGEEYGAKEDIKRQTAGFPGYTEGYLGGAGGGEKGCIFIPAHNKECLDVAMRGLAEKWGLLRRAGGEKAGEGGLTGESPASSHYPHSVEEVATRLAVFLKGSRVGSEDPNASSTHNARYLLVFEDPPSPHLVLPYLPSDSPHHFIITATEENRRGQGSKGGWERFSVTHLPPFTVQEGVEFIDATLGKESCAQDVADKETLVRVMGGHPLSLHLSLCYVKNNQISLSNYLAALSNPPNSPFKLPDPTPCHPPTPLTLPLLMSLTHLYHSDKLTLDLLSVCSYYDARGIPFSLFDSLCDVCGRVGEGVDLLVRYGVIQRVGSGIGGVYAGSMGGESICLSPAIQHTLRSILPHASSCLLKALKILLGYVTDMSDNFNMLFHRSFAYLSAHMISVVTHYQNAMIISPPLVPALTPLYDLYLLPPLLYSLAVLLIGGGQASPALHYLLLAQHVVQMVYGEGRQDEEGARRGELERGVCSRWVGWGYVWGGSLEEGEEHFNISEKILTSLLAQEAPVQNSNPTTSHASVHLPDRAHQPSQESKGDEEAEEGGQDGSALRMAVVIKELMCLYALRVETYKLAGKKQIAQDYQQKMMELPIVYQQTLSETQNAKVLDSQMTEKAVLGQALELLHNQARIIQSYGQYQEALAIHQDVLRKRLELFKEGSLIQLDIANSYFDVGVCQYKVHQYYLALVSLERAMNIRKLLVGEMHGDVAKVMVEMGHVYTLLQYRPNAVFMYERSLDIYKNIDAESEDTRKTWGLLGQSLVYVGRYEDALYAYNQAIMVYEKTQGHDCHGDIVTYLNSMASIVGAQGKLIEVILLAERSEQIIRMLQLQEQPISCNEEMKCVFSLARAYFELEHYRTANRYFKRYMVVYSACMKSHYISPLHPKIITTITFLDGMFRDYKMEKRYINDVSMLVLLEQNSSLFNPQGVQAEDGLILFYPFLPKAQQEIMQRTYPFLKATYSLQVVINVLKTCADYLFGRERHHIVRHDNMVNRFARKKILEKELQKHLTNMISEDKVTLRAIIKTCEACKFNLTPGQYSDLASISISKVLYIIEMEEIYQTDTRFAREGKLAMKMPHWSEDTKQLYIKRLREFHLFAHMRSYDKLYFATDQTILRFKQTWSNQNEEFVKLRAELIYRFPPSSSTSVSSRSPNSH